MKRKEVSAFLTQIPQIKKQNTSTHTCVRILDKDHLRPLCFSGEDQLSESRQWGDEPNLTELWRHPAHKGPNKRTQWLLKLPHYWFLFWEKACMLTAIGQWVTRTVFCLSKRGRINDSVLNCCQPVSGPLVRMVWCLESAMDRTGYLVQLYWGAWTCVQQPAKVFAASTGSEATSCSVLRQESSRVGTALLRVVPNSPLSDMLFRVMLQLHIPFHQRSRFAYLAFEILYIRSPFGSLSILNK